MQEGPGQIGSKCDHGGMGEVKESTNAIYEGKAEGD
jgi:hypothetical protein